MKKYLRIMAIVFAFLMAGNGSSAFAKCMVRSAVQTDGSTAISTVMVPNTKTADFAALGYQETNCGGIDKTVLRERFCDPSSFGNTGVQAQLQVQAGVPFAELCSSARAEAGLPETAQAAQARFSPTNRRPAAPPAGPSLLKALNGQTDATSSAGGK